MASSMNVEGAAAVIASADDSSNSGSGGDANGDGDASMSADQPSSTASAAAGPQRHKKPIVCIVMGMAGSGKTTLMQRINMHMDESGAAAYYINLDPAVKQVPFAANIDICDTVNYKEVMSQYGLGPNGGIMTSLNLFATRFDQVIELVEKRASELDYVFVDTPGQIEVFNWSASGSIIMESLASSFPTMLIYVVDTPRSTNPTTFMSNMLYACSVLYRSRLPLVATFTKGDVMSADFALEWMADFERFQEALDSSGDQSYMSSLNRSLSLVLEEFYSCLKTASVSAADGSGMTHLVKAIHEAAEDFEKEYLPELELRLAKVKKQREAEQAKDMKRLMQDLKISEGAGAANSTGRGGGEGNRGGGGGAGGSTGLA